MSEEFKAKRYACMQWPYLRIGAKVKFERGFYTANTPEEASLIESCESYGKAIHPIQWEPKEVPSVPTKVEALIEDEIRSALAAKQPRARRGAIGTK